MRRDRCAVCDVGTWEEDNLIVFCDGLRCGLMVHQKCYGIRTIPPDEDPWYCNVCAQKQKGIATCAVCGGREGAMKETVEGNWAHMICAFAMPELYFYQVKTLERICGLSHPSLRARTQACSICTNSQVGFTLKCSVPGCETAFHPMCQHTSHLPMELSPLAKNLKAHCEKHKDRAPEKLLERVQVRQRPTPPTPMSNGTKSKRIALVNRNLKFWSKVIGPHFQSIRSLDVFDRLINQESETLGSFIGELGEYFEDKWAREMRPYKRRRRNRYIEPLTSRRGRIEYSVNLKSTEPHNPAIVEDILPYLVMRCYVSRDPLTAKGVLDATGRLEIVGIEPRKSDFLLDSGEQETKHNTIESSIGRASDDEVEFTSEANQIPWIAKRDIDVDANYVQSHSAADLCNAEEDNEVVQDIRLCVLKLLALNSRLKDQARCFKDKLPLDLFEKEQTLDQQRIEDRTLEQEYRRRLCRSGELNCNIHRDSDMLAIEGVLTSIIDQVEVMSSRNFTRDMTLRRSQSLYHYLSNHNRSCTFTSLLECMDPIGSQEVRYCVEYLVMKVISTELL